MKLVRVGESGNERAAVLGPQNEFHCPQELRRWLNGVLNGKNNLSLAERLRDIVNRAITAGFPYVIQDTEQFVSDLSASRNRTAHGNSAGEDYEGQYSLTEGLTWLLRTLILGELGLTREQISLCLDQNLELSRIASAMLCESAWKSWRLHTLDVRMEHDRETNVEAIPR
jgi:hypothetical protein